MVRHDGADAKRERMERIAQKIFAALEKQGELALSVAFAEIEYCEGLTKEKITEYLETLEKLGRFALDEEQDKIKKAS
jgi:predicted transcriptional regulator